MSIDELFAAARPRTAAIHTDDQCRPVGHLTRRAGGRAFRRRRFGGKSGVSCRLIRGPKIVVSGGHYMDTVIDNLVFGNDIRTNGTLTLRFLI